MQKIDEKELVRINEWLAKEYGYFEGLIANWRVVWSNDEMEKRWLTHTKEGFAYNTPIVGIVPKYRNWNANRYVLERVLPIPSNVETDLVEKYSAEPVWTFEDSKGNYLPPNREAIKFVIKTVYEAAAKATGYAKYKDPNHGLTKDDLKEKEKARLAELQLELFGNETDAGDALAYGYGVSLSGPKFEQAESASPLVTEN